MEESYTKDQLGKIVVNKVIREIENWANHELKFITYKYQSPVCLPIGKNTWLVGHFKIIRNKKKQFLVYNDSNIIHKFYVKQAAFLYAIMNKANRYELSNRILNSDRMFGYLLEEQEMLILKQLKYKKISNSFKLGLTQAKLSDVNRKLISIKKDLEKNLNLAKYVKVWD